MIMQLFKCGCVINVSLEQKLKIVEYLYIIMHYTKTDMLKIKVGQWGISSLFFVYIAMNVNALPKTFTV
jgi:hypothetical protein